MPGIEGEDILIVEDILDSGRTLACLRSRLLEECGARRVRICCLLDKPARRLPTIDLRADFTGFTIENVFLVGYGLDFDERYRHLPYLAVLAAPPDNDT